MSLPIPSAPVASLSASAITVTGLVVLNTANDFSLVIVMQALISLVGLIEGCFGFGTDAYTLGVMAVLILLGGFGVAVLYDLGNYWKARSLALNTRITLMLTAILTSIGLIVMLLDSAVYRGVLDHLSFGEQLVVSLFTVISARTAGLMILPLDELNYATQLVLMIWMFIGGAPASMAGGVSSSTIGVLLFFVIATARGRTAAVA